MIDFWKNTFGKFHSVILTNDLEWVYLVIAIAFMLSTVITWYLNSLKLSKETLKLKEERLKLIAEIEKITIEKKKLEVDILKVNSEIGKTNAENLKLYKEADKLVFEQSKTIQETKLLTIAEKEKLIGITKSVGELNDQYNKNLEYFLDKLQELQIKSTSEPLTNYEISKIIDLFYIKIINPFTSYFTLWRSLYEYDFQEKTDFINVRLTPFLNLSTSLLKKLIGIGGELKGSMITGEVFKPIVTFGKNNANTQITNQVNELCAIFNCEY